jgi:transketolase
MENKELAARIRQDVLQMTHDAKCSHVGSCLSIADILAVLYGGILKVDPKNPNWQERDRFILSKGHACAALYAVLAEKGFFPKELLSTFYQSDSLLEGHINHHIAGVEVSTGSLGHGLSIGCGMAISNKNRVYVLLSDGDCNEGSTWESAMFASHHRLGNLTVIVDYNKMQALGKSKDILDLELFANMWFSFGWTVREIDGHDLEEIEKTFNCLPFRNRFPSCIIAHTVKGKGVSCMEDKVEWHYKYPNDEELEKALAELK